MDSFDKKILQIIQKSAGLSNTAIGDAIGLSASQVSRRRRQLENTGVIVGYRAVLNPEALGFTLDAIIRIKLATHSEQSARTTLNSQLVSVLRTHGLATARSSAS